MQVSRFSFCRRLHQPPRLCSVANSHRSPSFASIFRELCTFGAFPGLTAGPSGRLIPFLVRLLVRLFLAPRLESKAHNVHHHVRLSCGGIDTAGARRCSRPTQFVATRQGAEMAAVCACLCELRSRFLNARTRRGSTDRPMRHESQKNHH